MNKKDEKTLETEKRKVPFNTLRKGVMVGLLGVTLGLGCLGLAGCTNGQDGKDGAQWYKGIDTPTTQGVNGDFYIDTNDYILYQKTNGEWIPIMYNFGKPGQDANAPSISINDEGYWVINGVTTDVKAKGEDGKAPTITIEEGYWVIDGIKTNTRAEAEDGDGTWLVGANAPKESQGNNGDMYLDNTYWDMYHKVDGKWLWLGNMKEDVSVSSNAKEEYEVSETAPSLTLTVKQSGKNVQIPVTSDMFESEPNWNCAGIYNMIIKYQSATYTKTIKIYNAYTEEIKSLPRVTDKKVTNTDIVQDDVGYNEYVDYTDISKYFEVEVTCALWYSNSSEYHTAINFYDEDKQLISSYNATNLADYGVTIPSTTQSSYNVDGVVLPTNGAKYIRFCNKTGTGSDDNNASGYSIVDAKLVGHYKDTGLTKSSATSTASIQNVASPATTLSKATQGGAAYGKYLFNFCDGLQAYVLDLESMNILYTNTSFVEANSQYHCNNVNFGTELYEDTGFPLLYVSQENESQHKVLVYAVSQNGNNFTFELKQTITYPTNEDAGMYYQNCFIDEENGYIYLSGYSVYSYTSAANNNMLVIKKYALPSVEDGDVQLYTEDVLYTTQMPFNYATQGGFIKDNKFIQVFGVADSTRKLRIIDLETGIYQEINLTEAGLTEEPENIFMYNGDYYITSVSNKIYKLTIAEAE